MLSCCDRSHTAEVCAGSAAQSQLGMQQSKCLFKTNFQMSEASQIKLDSNIGYQEYSLLLPVRWIYASYTKAWASSKTKNIIL